MNLRTIVKIAISFLFLYALVHFSPSARAEIPNLIGQWSGDYEIGSPGTMIAGKCTINIVEQKGATFRASNPWRAALEGPEFLLGVISHDETTITMVENNTPAQISGKLIGSNKMELIFINPGTEPRVGRLTLFRPET